MTSNELANWLNELKDFEIPHRRLSDEAIKELDKLRRHV